MIRVAVLLGLVACSVEARSDGFRCEISDDCDGDRVCDQGWCVAGDEGGGGDCPAACSECIGATCVINCPNANVCDGAIVCPSGFDCEVNCDGNNTCAAVDCSAADSCRVSCNGTRSCGGSIICADEGSCEIDCDGEDSCAGSITSGAGPTEIDCAIDTCTGGIDCAGACRCAVECSGDCVEPSCPMGDTCSSNNGGCETTGQCDTC